MKKLLLTLLALSIIAPTVLAHAAHGSSEEDLDTSPQIEMPSPTTLFVSVSGLVSAVLIVLFFRDPGLIENEKLVAGTLALVLLISLTGFFASFEQKEDMQSFGPERSSLHMQGFYQELDSNQLDEAQSIVHEPASMPERITRDEERTVNITLKAEEVKAPLTENSSYYFWTFNGTVPGPTLRVREGDTVRLIVENAEDSTHNHSIDLHAVTGPGGGAGVLGDVPPGEERTIEFEADKEGFYMYHCATPNVPTHIANGMYGGIIVQPREGMHKVDKEFTVAQGEIYTNDSIGSEGFQAFSPEKMINENPTYYTVNGRPHGLTGENRLQAEVNDSVRIYYLNAGNSKISSFHIIGEIFDSVYSGTLNKPSETNTGAYAVPNSQGNVFELELENPGNYTLVDHALARTERGAWSVLEVEGEKNQVPIERTN